MHRKCRIVLRSPLLILVSAQLIFAQSAAVQALNDEPEMKQIKRISEQSKSQQQLPYNDARKQAPLASIFRDYNSMKATNMLMNSLKARLQSDAEQCGHCKAKEDELAALVAQQAATDAMLNAVFRQMGFPTQVKDFDSLDAYLSSAFAEFKPKPAPGQPDIDAIRRSIAEDEKKHANDTRWNNSMLALNEAARAIDAHCKLASPSNVLACERQYNNIVVSGEHEKAWRTCFTEHDYLATPQNRTAFDACMNEQDPETKFCTEELRLQRKPGSCPGPTTTALDAEELRKRNDPNYYKQFNVTDSEAIAISVPARATLKVTLLEPISTYGARPNHTFRARLDETVLGEYGAAAMPAGSDILILARVSGGSTSLRAVSAVVKGNTSHLNTGELNRDFPGSIPGDRLFYSAGTKLSFQTNTSTGFFISKTEMDRLQKEAAAKGTAPKNVPTRPIPDGSRLPLILVEAVDLGGARAGRSFHAQLSEAMGLPPVGVPQDALVLPAGTDVYLKITGLGEGTTSGIVQIDYILIDNQKVYIPTYIIRCTARANRSAAAGNSPAQPRAAVPNIRVPWQRGPSIGFPSHTSSSGSSSGTAQASGTDNMIFYAAQTKLRMTTLESVDVPVKQQTAVTAH